MDTLGSIAHVYLIHLDRPLKHARHYVGFCAAECPEDRLKRHKSGNGARMLRAANLVGIDYHIIRTWDNLTIHQARQLECRLKRQHNAPRLCPVCNKHLILQQENIK